ncbi:hypothetical protein B0A48_11240 [Cryoendolithus antarcticus]|uniref:BZIP domain-containing protein n=1 Tax=Cryoendolithus antarcticus TaxID=1507870 RepID=A0A1V8SUU7_9PEZI|nr:hypothetical protein B0A48_11240 [Cryoendolithus antarcticus]
MSNFAGARRAPNVSQYLANLNTIPSQQEMAAQQADFDLGNDGLDFLTNTEFFDFDASTFGNGLTGGDFSAAASAPVLPSAAGNGAAVAGMLRHHTYTDSSRPRTDEIVTAPSYQFSEFQTYPPSMVNSPSALSPSTPTTLAAFHASHPASKRKASTALIADLEEQSRNVAEEDKRRRNTAASARFRVKKKQREQALEKQTKEMTEKVSSLEGKVQQLEMENKWLKGLITEKSDRKGMEEQFRMFRVQREEAERARKVAERERSLETRDDGVGTEEDAEAEMEE